METKTAALAESMILVVASGVVLGKITSTITVKGRDRIHIMSTSQ
jgi:hypothetical protein